MIRIRLELNVSPKENGLPLKDNPLAKINLAFAAKAAVPGNKPDG